MSVIVIGVDIPEDCDSCWLPGKYCKLWFATDVGERHRGCHIRPLPEKHGRIVDVGSLEVVAYNQKDHEGESFDEGVCYILAKLDALPTIVEADGE